jgi:hypothetical protein
VLVGAVVVVPFDEGLPFDPFPSVAADIEVAARKWGKIIL